MRLLLMTIQFGRCVFSSRTGNQHCGDECEPGGEVHGEHAGLLCQHSGRRLFRPHVLDMGKVYVSLVIVLSRRPRLAWKTTDIQMFRSAAAITCRSAGCPSPTKGCIGTTRTTPTWSQPSTVVRTSFPVNLNLTKRQILR